MRNVRKIEKRIIGIGTKSRLENAKLDYMARVVCHAATTRMRTRE